MYCGGVEGDFRRSKIPTSRQTSAIDSMCDTLGELHVNIYLTGRLNFIFDCCMTCGTGRLLADKEGYPWLGSTHRTIVQPERGVRDRLFRENKDPVATWVSIFENAIQSHKDFK